MSFGNAALLLGMGLGLIPIVIHLINRHRAKLRRFAAIDFLLLSDKRVARRLKLKQLLVLALRVLLLVALALALAKPYVDDDRVAAGGTSDPAGIALVIDDSMSMHATEDDGERLLDRALGAARALVAEGGPRTSFAVVTAGDPARTMSQDLVYDRAAIERSLQRIDARPRAGDLTAALREAGRVLSDAPERRRLIYVLSDQAAHAWGPVSLSWDFVPATEITRIDPREGRPLDNTAVTGASITRVDGGAIEIDAALVHHGADARDVVVELRLGDTVVAERVQIAAGARAEVRFNVQAPLDVGRGTIALAEDDALPTDDVWYFTLERGQRVNALLVNGAPRNVATLDELYFLRAMLRARHAGDVPIRTVTTTADALTPSQIAAVDVVVLANVGALNAEQSLALRNFVEGGGGLLITAGDNVDAAETTRSYGPLLPYPVRGTKIVADPDAEDASLSALSLATIDFSHPVMEVFEGLEDASLFRAQIFGYALLDTAPREGARVVASYTGGVPALVEAPLGRGRVMLLTTTIDRDWADLALRSSVVPLMQRAVRHLGRALGSDAGAGFLVGRDLRVAIPDGAGPLALTRPDGERVELAADAGDERTGTIFIEAPDLAGHYSLARAGDPRRAVDFAVNADRTESDLTPAADDTVAPIIAEITRDNGILPARAPNEDMIVASAGGDGRRTVLWPYILAGLFLLFAAEAWLVVRG